MRAAALALLATVAWAGVAHAQTKVPAYDPTFNKPNVIRPVRLPDELGNSSTYNEEIVELYLRGRFHWTGGKGFNPIRPDFLYMTFLDRVTKNISNIYVKDQFTLVFSDGSTVKVEFLGPFAPSTNFFQILHGSEKHRSVYSPTFLRDHPIYQGDPEHEWPGSDADCGRDFHVCGK